MTKSPVTVNSLWGGSFAYPCTKYNMIDSTFKLLCAGNKVTVSTDADPGVNTDAMSEFSVTWEDAGLKIENGMVKAGMYKLVIDAPADQFGQSNEQVRMLVNVERDITLEEFNQALDGGIIEKGGGYSHTCSGKGYGNFNSSESASFRWNNLYMILKDSGVEMGDSFDIVFHRDEQGKIYAELPNGVRLTEDVQPDSIGSAQYELGYETNWNNVKEYYALYLFFDISQYDLDSVESGFTFEIEVNGNIYQHIQFGGFTPASTSTAGSLSASKQWWIQSGDTEGNGFFIEFDKMNTHVLGIRNLDVSTHDGAQEAISASQKALGIVSEMRSKIGAQQNRLEYAASNSRNMAENAQNAESRIRDMDMAEEMVANATANILVQAGQSILAQNNHKADGVLELLR